MRPTYTQMATVKAIVFMLDYGPRIALILVLTLMGFFAIQCGTRFLSLIP